MKESHKIEERSNVKALVNSLYLQGGMVTPIIELSLTLPQKRLQTNVIGAAAIGVILIFIGGLIWAVSDANTSKTAVLGYMVISSGGAILGAAGLAKHIGFIVTLPLEEFISQLNSYIDIHNQAVEALQKAWLGNSILPGGNHAEWKHSLEINKEKWTSWAATALSLVGTPRINSVKQNKIQYQTGLVRKMRADMVRKITPEHPEELSRGGLSLIHSKPNRL